MSGPVDTQTHVFADGGADGSAGGPAVLSGAETAADAGAGDTGDAAVAAAEPDDFKKATDYGWTVRQNLDYHELQQVGDYNQWLGAAQVYEWDDEFGDVAPRLPDLERILYGTMERVTEGGHRETLDEIHVMLEGPTKVAPIQKFEDGGLHPVILENIEHCGYGKPTPIQAYTIPAVKLGHDVVGIAQTGSGKTAAYLIPILSALMGKAKKLRGPRPNADSYKRRDNHARGEPLVLIIVPTRELAVQVFDEARRLCYRSMLRPCVSYGGFPLGQNIEDLGKGCDILIGTCGRIKDLMGRPGILSMNRVKFTVIDEADEMLGDNWADEMKAILSGGDANEDADHVYMMFSATFPKHARQVARAHMESEYLRIRVGRAGQAHKNIKQEIIQVDRNNARQAVYDLLFSLPPTRTLIFCNAKASVDHLDDYLYNKGLPTTSIHSGRNAREREDAIRSFRVGTAPILIATGVSARGWDIKDVHHVINFELPSGMHGGIQEYVHRIGRTARIGNQGLATSFYNDRNDDIAQQLVNVLVECDQTVPAFLQHLQPEQPTDINFGDDSDEGENCDGEWGAAEAPDADDAGPAATGFEAEDAEPAPTGFGAEDAEPAPTGFEVSAPVDGSW